MTTIWKRVAATIALAFMAVLSQAVRVEAQYGPLGPKPTYEVEPTPPGQGATREALASTGFDSTPLLIVAAVLVVVGLAMLYVRKLTIRNGR